MADRDDLLNMLSASDIEYSTDQGGKGVIIPAIDISTISTETNINVFFEFNDEGWLLDVRVCVMDRSPK